MAESPQRDRVEIIKWPGAEARAKELLASLMSYEDWINTTDPTLLEQIKRHSGEDLRTHYDKLVGGITDVAEHGSVKEIRVWQAGHQNTVAR